MRPAATRRCSLERSPLRCDRSMAGALEPTQVDGSPGGSRMKALKVNATANTGVSVTAIAALNAGLLRGAKARSDARRGLGLRFWSAVTHR